MATTRETEPTLPGTSIPSIDRMFGVEKPAPISYELKKSAYDQAMPRAQAVCGNLSVEGDDYSRGGIVAYSDPMLYRVLYGGQQINMRICISRRKISALTTETETYDLAGLLVEIDDGGNGVARNPFIELSEHHLWASPNTTIDNKSRTDDLDDLVSLSRALNLFDGQGEIIT